VTIPRIEWFDLKTPIVFSRLDDLYFGHGDVKHESPPLATHGSQQRIHTGSRAHGPFGPPCFPAAIEAWPRMRYRL
jgi:hypothetical protein